MGVKLAVDIGGTFTDLIFIDDDSKELNVVKVPSKPKNPEKAVEDGLQKIKALYGVQPQDIIFFIHGTTVATNALLEGKGVPVALLVTEGFQDVLFIARQDRPKLYDIFEKRPVPPVKRRFIYGVPERIAFDGKVLKSLDEEAIVNICRDIKAKGIHSIAACYLNSYCNFAHELKTKEIIESVFPEADVSLSCEVLPELGEYERMSTTAINSSILPKMKEYISRLDDILQNQKVASALHIVQSNGGIMTAQTATEKCVNTILSGPAGGALGGVMQGQAVGMDNVITLDVGGTSADISLAYQGNLGFENEVEVGGYPVKARVIDVHTIGAGGGSIAWIDTGGALRVGPQSAGADPGPACYDIGGTEPTVTDANTVLGRLNPKALVGGAMQIDKGKSFEVINEKIAKPFGLSVEQAAEGIIKVMNMNMIRGIRYVSVEKGYDPREFALIVFGGGGPLHAVELAKELEIKNVIVPRFPGVNSAFGMLMADFRFDYVRTYLKKLGASEKDFLTEGFKELEEQALEEMRKNGVATEKVSLFYSLDLRYLGQRHPIEVPIPSDQIRNMDNIVNTFHELHLRKYGFEVRDNEIELMNFRLASIGEVVKPTLEKFEKQTDETILGSALKETRPVFLDGDYCDCPVYVRDLLLTGQQIPGPAVLEQLDTTSLVFPGQTAVVDEFLNLIIDL
jgi:N-methylhydantoinase A